MHKYTCIVCGKQGESRNAGRQFYGNRCAVAAHRRRLKGSETEQQCRFNEGVACNGGDCSACGWNPEVAKERARRLGV